MKTLIISTLLIIISLSVFAQKDTVAYGKWYYSEEINKMTNEKSFYAQNFSEDVNENKTSLKIIVRYKDKENEVLLFIDGGLFDTPVGNYQVSLKFDNGKIEKYYTSVSRDNEFNTIFLRNQKSLIKKLKSCKNLLLQAYIYGSGDKVYKFNVDGFAWDH